MIIQPGVKCPLRVSWLSEQKTNAAAIPSVFSSPAVSQSVSTNSAHSIAELTRARKEMQSNISNDLVLLCFSSRLGPCLVSRSLPQVRQHQGFGFFTGSNVRVYLHVRSGRILKRGRNGAERIFRYGSERKQETRDVTISKPLTAIIPQQFECNV